MIRAPLALALCLSPALAVAQAPPVALDAASLPPSLARRIRAELSAVGHPVLDGPRPAPVRVRAASDSIAWQATVTVEGHGDDTVRVLRAEPESEGLFALRVVEAVRATMLRAPLRPPSDAPPVVAPAPVVMPSPARLLVGLGLRGRYAPGGVDALVLPAFAVRVGGAAHPLAPWAEVGVAGPSAFGAAPSGLRLSTFEVSAAGGIAWRVRAPLALEFGARAVFLALALDASGSASARGGQWALEGMAAVRWRVHTRVSLRAGLSLGATLGAVDVGNGGAAVAEWGRPLVGAEVGADAHLW